MFTLSRAQRGIVILLTISGVLAVIYASISIGIAMIMAYQPQVPVTRTPSSLGLRYQNVTFPSRQDHLLLRGWFIPGILPNGSMTVERTVIMVHGMHTNRATNLMLDLSGALSRNGIAVLAFDMRGHGESTPAPLGWGYFEQRDVLGAVDFLRSGSLPYPELGHPRFIGGWGISLGGVALLFAAAQEPAIKALVIDSAYATSETLVKGAFGPAFLFIPATRVIAQMLYGLDYYTVRPVDVVAKIAPRPLLFINGANDTIVSPANMTELALAASTAPGAHVQSWLVPHAGHIEAYPRMKNIYVQRLVAIFTVRPSTETRSASSE
jgi:uncharacterized protein